MSGATLPLFGVSILTSALLVFVLQPMVAKSILPWFGGAAGVWAVCLAFYQTTLFLGYAYAHALVRIVSARTQIYVHAGLFIAAWCALPVVPGVDWQPEAGDPSVSVLILTMLSANVALPFLFLSSTGPLLQAWFTRVLPGRPPYRLYAVSNLGSFIALASYPFLIEPALPVSTQATAWSWAFSVCGLAVLACGAVARFAAATADPPLPNEHAGTTPGTPWRWFSLSAFAVMLLMSITNELCRDVASIPFLWVIPLALYLLTFVLCFGSERFYRRAAFVALSLVSLGGVVFGRDLVGSFAPSLAYDTAISLDILFYSLALFCGCSVAHGELYASRPDTRRLTAFYLWISAGGAAGGLFVGIAAPWLFSDFYELALSWLACWMLVGVVWWQEANHANGMASRRLAAAALIIAVWGTAAFPWRLSEPTLLVRERNFFGVLRVLENNPRNRSAHRITLRHGAIVHGYQLQAPESRRHATAYYGALSGVGHAVHVALARGPANVGVVGLGAGTMAAYGRKGDRIEFYELDPDVVRIARDSGHFSFLADCPASIHVTLGDARLSLAAQYEEAGSKGFDLLVIDAFSSDAIPVHLLTVEAMALYHSHMSDDGLMAFHLSSRNLSLTPLVFRLAAELGLHALEIANRPLGPLYHDRSRWVLVAQNEAALESVESRVRAVRRQFALELEHEWMRRPTAEGLARAPLWTDDYSNLFSLLRDREPPSASGF